VLIRFRVTNAEPKSPQGLENLRFIPPDLQPLKTFAPRVRSKMVTLRRRTYSAEEISDARRTALHISDRQIDTSTKAKAVCILDTVAKQNEPLEVEVQAITISEQLAIVALPGEIFAELGLSLKIASPFKRTFIAELANGSIGYIPNRSAYSEGLYEVFSARCTEGSGELLVGEALKLLNALAKP
jgi:neutral ceramidase